MLGDQGLLRDQGLRKDSGPLGPMIKYPKDTDQVGSTGVRRVPLDLKCQTSSLMSNHSGNGDRGCLLFAMLGTPFSWILFSRK